MSRAHVAVLLALALFVVPARAGERSAMIAAARTPAPVPDELLVRLRAEATTAPASVAEHLGDRLQRALGARYAVVKLEAGRTLAEALAAYRAMPEVEAVQPNYRYRFLAVPNDPLYPQLWALDNDGQPVEGGTPAAAVPGSDLDMERAWDEITDCTSVIVAVLDSGVNYLHRDLAGNLWDGSAAGFPLHGYDFLDDDNDPMPEDAFGHGTHVAATIGAVGNNGIGVAGVCWRARIMALRIGDRRGATTARIVQAMQFAIEHGARVINLSLGGSEHDPAFEAEVERARRLGVLVVTAAGNQGTDNDDDATPFYPCDFPQDNVVCTAALDQSFSLAGFSNFGAVSVDLGAPGTNILSAWPGRVRADDLRGWVRTGGWAEAVCNFNLGRLPALVNPATWCATPPGTYAADANDVAYKAFDLAGVRHARANFFRFLATEPDADYLGYAMSPAGGDPFAAGTLIALHSGSTGTRPIEESVDLDGCATSSCTFGFRLQSNGAVADRGVAIVGLRIDTVEPNADAYAVLQGTSMAAPHVAGVAALVWAYNPRYTYADVRTALIEGGEPIGALAGVTASGRALNAYGALQYIAPPAGVAAVVR